MIFLLDTNAWIEAMSRPTGVVAERIDAAAERGAIAVADFVRGELLEGAYLSDRPEEDIAFVQRVLAPYPTHPFDGAAANAYARVRAHLRRAGTPIGPIDTAIAATALAHGCTVVTHNRQHFDRVPGLAVEDWQAKEDL